MEEAEETQSIKSRSSRSSSPSLSHGETNKPGPAPSTAAGRRLHASSPPTSSFGRPVKKYPVRIGIQWKVGARLEAKDFQGKWYAAKIVEINSKDNSVLVHFDGWNARYDEYLEMSSDDLRPLTRHSERKETRSRSMSKSDHKIGECVFAKWTDCRMYPGRITAVHDNGSYEVLFYDGFKKNVTAINVKTMPPEVQEEYAKAGLLPEIGKKTKFPIKDYYKELEKLKSAKGQKQGLMKAEEGDPEIESKSENQMTRLSTKSKKRVHSESQPDTSSDNIVVAKKPRKTSLSCLSYPGDTLTSEPPREQFQCPHPECVKTFRKQKLLESHVRHYHPESLDKIGLDLEDLSKVKTDTVSEESEGSHKRSLRKRSETISKEASQDDNVSEGDTKTTSTEEYQMEEEEGIDHMEKDEVVNCICQINEENGLMIQCDVCLCWQHAACMEISEETLPQKYICYVCSNPPGIRESARCIHEQDWLTKGTLPHLSFIPKDHSTAEKSQTVEATHALVGDVLNVETALRAGLIQLSRAQRPDVKKNPQIAKYYLEKIRPLHTKMQNKLNNIEKEIKALEQQTESGLFGGEMLRDTSKLKKTMQQLVKDANKVKKLAQFPLEKDGIFF